MNHKNDINTPVYSILTTTVFQKESFCTAKGLLFACKRTRFGEQKDSFWKAKGSFLGTSTRIVRPPNKFNVNFYSKSFVV